ncbi:rod shape-determining protein MreD [Bacillus tianshenii]|uniref:rod shape-determining protein MreD n=1 Tax=Sutcliffiella tianshenii TaxID=1463404 RepID=UPI001CD1B898|nr:rod shape-determining protein MreD [Bacillus tianshenii]MCA1318757.1 rod shape-determining protein MreD [Bacillus tianshenii]
MRKYVLPALILCLFVLESMTVDMLFLGNIKEDWVIVPRYVLITLILCTIYTGSYIGIIFGMVFGLLYDIVYTEVLGVYLFAYPVASYFVSKLMKALQANIFIAFFMIVLAVAGVEYLVYSIHTLIGTTNILHQDYLTGRLVPTLIFNAIFTLIFIFPLKLFMEKLAYEQKDEL